MKKKQENDFYTFYDQKRDAIVEITGVLVASAITGQDLLRQTEIKIFRTENGRYAVVTIGSSKVFHSAEKGCKNRHGQTLGEETTYELLEDRDEPCPKCKPAEDGYLDQKVFKEVDFVSVRQAHNINGVGKCLEGIRENGETFMSNVSKQAWYELTGSYSRTVTIA